jgi:hypothetical protein
LKLYNDYDDNYIKCKSISEGAFHLFVNFDDIEPFLNEHSVFSPIEEYRIVECIIPRKSICYYGLWGSVFNYASNRIIVTDKTIEINFKK